MSDDLLIALGNSAGQLLVEEYEKLDPLGRKIWKSYFAARSEMMGLTEGADKGLYHARTLKFKYPG
jgi:hypothetical protein